MKNRHYRSSLPLDPLLLPARRARGIELLLHRTTPPSACVQNGGSMRMLARTVPRKSEGRRLTWNVSGATGAPVMIASPARWVHRAARASAARRVPQGRRVRKAFPIVRLPKARQGQQAWRCGDRHSGMESGAPLVPNTQSLRTPISGLCARSRCHSAARAEKRVIRVDADVTVTSNQSCEFVLALARADDWLLAGEYPRQPDVYPMGNGDNSRLTTTNTMHSSPRSSGKLCRRRHATG